MVYRRINREIRYSTSKIFDYYIFIALILQKMVLFLNFIKKELLYIFFL